jgi:hypothetical protein
VWLAYSFPAFDGVGARRYIQFQYQISKKLVCWIRWANTSYKDKDTISSGGETIDGNQRNDIKFQLKMTF